MVRSSSFLLFVLLFACRADDEEGKSLDADGDGLEGSEDCDDSDAAVGAPTDWFVDEDGDSFAGDQPVVACERPDDAVDQRGDCDDNDTLVNPAAVELCDGLDNNCAEGVDEGVMEVFYADADDDGFGDAAVSEAACEPREGLVSNDDDCDDTLADVHPDAPEYCNGRDDDCDGAVDDGAAEQVAWYADADGDGFGDPTEVVWDCNEVPGRLTDSADCDDTNASVHPDADEVCNGRDDDCDGLVDDDTAVDPTTWYLDTDGDGYGSDTSTWSSCEAPDGYVALNGDCDDTSTMYHPDASESDCTDPNDYNCDGSVGYADVDGDGWAACAECDDVNASNYPGAIETCDGADNDCDGTIDEADAIDALTWYADADGDGYGDPAVATLSCDAPFGSVADNLDCDDADSLVNPAGVESCNGVDDDCDGAVDEDTAVDAATWYTDGDGDGYGDASTSSTACSQPAGSVADNTDCNDARSTAHPGATEYCNTEDDDCDGVVDNDAADARTYWQDSDADGYGNAAVYTEACSTPAGYTRDDDDCDDTDASVNPGAAELCNGVDDDCNGSVDDGAGGTTTFYEDSDGDGYGDSGSTTLDCSVPAGFVSDSTDCEDGDASINPAAIDDCDTLDNDCSGYADDGGLCPCEVVYNATDPYLFCATTVVWSAARTECLTYGYDLVAIGSSAENSWLNTEALARGWTSSYTFWMGFNDAASEGSWVWSNGESVVYTNWNSGEPNDASGEDCAHTYSSGTWNDIPCTGYPARYVCEA